MTPVTSSSSVDANGFALDRFAKIMLPIDRLETDEARSLAGLLFDLDDTFVDHGKLGEAAYGALFRLREAGLELVVVTGRPAGWGEVLARQWPVLGVVTENGAIALSRRRDRVIRIDPTDAAQRQLRRERLALLVAAVRERCPALSPADDVDARCSDFTFDIGEHQRLPEETAQEAIEFCRGQGARVTRSSVHLHVSFDGDDKASGAVRLLGASLGVDPTTARFRFAFIGDSENDAACFAAFRTTIAVRNLSGRPTVQPRFVTRAERSAGFVEAAERICERRLR
jgi:HAD superfamily hydrolase (TIGR01484 family)